MPKRKNRDSIEMSIQRAYTELTWAAQDTRPPRVSVQCGEYIVAGTNIGYRVRLTATRFTITK